MPLLAFGTGGIRSRRAEELIEYALRSGYRHLDSAASYPSHRDGSLARAVWRSDVPRQELFLTTKIPTSDMGFAQARSALERLRGELPGSFADLCLVHWPRVEGQVRDGGVTPELQVVERAGTWRALEEAYDQGLCRAIGVSNYLTKHLQELSQYARVQPAVNQIEYAPGAPLGDVVDFCQRAGIVLEVFGWLLPHNLEQLGLNSVAEAVGRPPAHVLLRWFAAQGMVPLFKSEREERILENAQALSDSFELTQSQIETIAGQTRTDYPWSYYKGEAGPWNIPTMSFAP